jgi:hypothetical protein
MRASSSAISTRCVVVASGSVVGPVMTPLWRGGRQRATSGAHELWCAGFGGPSSMVVSRITREPSYPNWQRKRIQNPCSVSSSLTEGTRKTSSEAVSSS